MNTSQGFGHFQPPTASGSGGRQIAQQLMLESFTVLEKTPSGLVPVPPEKREFVLIATAMNIALELLESPTGKHMLHELGRALVREWISNGNITQFRGDESLMHAYVDYFVHQMRHNTPNVVIHVDMVNRDVIALLAKRMHATSDLDAFYPREAAHFEINPRLVQAMIVNDNRLWQPSSTGRHSSEAEKAKKKAKRHYDTFLFTFGVAFVHESCHAFTAYLAGNASLDTPPTVSYLTYSQDQPLFESGESGRWAENWLLGGSLELYYDPEDDEFQPGLPHLLDQLAKAWPIKYAAMQSFISNVRRCEFPLRTGSRALSLEDRIQHRIVSLGFNDPAPIVASHQTMRALREAGQPPAYNIPVRDLRALALDHRAQVRIVPAN